jgi:hypothetical protein
VAAVTHILFSVTNPASPSSACIEPQLWMTAATAGGQAAAAGSGALAVGGNAANNKQSASDILVSLGGKQFARPNNLSADAAGASNPANTLNNNSSSSSIHSGGSSSSQPSVTHPTALGGIVKLLGQYVERKDVVRAACRLLNNLGGFAGIVWSRSRKCVCYSKLFLQVSSLPWRN